MRKYKTNFDSSKKKRKKKLFLVFGWKGTEGKKKDSPLRRQSAKDAKITFCVLFSVLALSRLLKNFNYG